MREIHGYEGRYGVDRSGNIFNLRTKKSLKPSDNGTGYYQVVLYSERKPKYHYVHRLVASAYSELISGKPHVNHKNGIKSDNRIENLEWCSQLENNRHAFKTGLAPAHRIKHGTMNEYNNFKCRCDLCREAWRIYYNKMRKK